MTTAGGPLLTVADMLLDLSEESSLEDVTLGGSSASPSPLRMSSSTQEPNPGPQKQVLSESFKETYNQLNVALKESGHTWTGLTQELCSTLTTADRLVAIANTNLGQLSVEVTRLEKIVKRGQDTIGSLQGATNQNTNAPSP